MKVDPKVIHYPNRQAYLAREGATAAPTAPTTGSASQSEAAAKPDLSGEAPLTSPIPTAPTAEANLAEEAMKVAKKVAELPPGSGEVLKSIVPTKVEEIDVPAENWDRPAILFISGMKLPVFGSDDGVEKMAQQIKGAEHYTWDQKSKIMDDILKRPPEQPLILIGHSLGSDTAVKIARELDKIEHQFRTVDLLVTMDSLGFNNDIISPNVELNLNFIGHKNPFLNDGPNIARDIERTTVINELTDASHSQIDNSGDIQRKVFEEIERTLSYFL